nr:hypothetical protein [Bacteroidales bacterium]
CVIRPLCLLKINAGEAIELNNVSKFETLDFKFSIFHFCFNSTKIFGTERIITTKYIDIWCNNKL